MRRLAAVPVEVFRTPEEMGEALARRIIAGVETSLRLGKRFLLGCPSGRTPRAVYQALGRLAPVAGVDLSRLVIVMMDDFALPEGEGFRNCPGDAHCSGFRFAKDEIVQVLNSGLPVRDRVSMRNCWVPNAADPGAFEAHIAENGGIDLFLAAMGESDGHVAFNPPGTPAGSRTRIIPLADTTRTDNLGSFPQFAGLAEVPRHGVSVGLGTIAAAREVALMIHGKNKRKAAEKLLGYREFSPDWPATFIFNCPQGRILLDDTARPVVFPLG